MSIRIRTLPHAQRGRSVNDASRAARPRRDHTSRRTRSGQCARSRRRMKYCVRSTAGRARAAGQCASPPALHRARYITLEEPVSFVLYWGKGLRSSVAAADPYRRNMDEKRAFERAFANSIFHNLQRQHPARAFSRAPAHLLHVFAPPRHQREAVVHAGRGGGFRARVPRLLSPGDKVTFAPVSLREYEEMLARAGKNPNSPEDESRWMGAAA